MSNEKIIKLLEEINGNLICINDSLVSAQANTLSSSEDLEKFINSVRPGIKPEIIIRGVLAKVQGDIEKELEAKTGWGRVELKRMIANILSNADKWGVENFK